MKKVILLGSFFLGIILLMPFFHAGLYSTHDGINHVARFAAYFQAFSDRQFPPSWAGGVINQGYGSPLFLFFYPLPGYIASVFHLLHFSFEDCFKLIMALSLLSMGVTWYAWINELTKDRKLAVLSALFYVVLPYHMLDVYVRGDIGEVLSFVFLPLVFWAVQKRFSKKSFFVGSVSYGLVLLSHNVMALIFTPVILVYGLIVARSKKELITLLTMISLGLGMSAFFWLPALLESRYLNTALYIGDLYKIHFLNFFQIVYSHWGFGPDVNKPGGLSPQLGVMYVIFLVGLLLFFGKKFVKNYLVIFWLSIFIIAIFLTLPVSTVVWSHIAILRHFQFPWRFMALAGFASCFLITYFLSKTTYVVQFLITTILVISILPFIGVKGYMQHNDFYYSHFTGTTYFHGEATPLWVAGDPSKQASSRIEIIAGEGVIKTEVIKTQQQRFSIDAKSQLRVVDNTIYFPGWKVYVDGVKMPIEFQDMNYRGLITFYVPQGVHSVKLEFGDTPLRLFAKVISLINFGILLLLLVLRKNRHEKN